MYSRPVLIQGPLSWPVLIRGFFSFRCDSTSKLKEKLEYVRALLKDATTFKKIYRYAFDFCRVGNFFLNIPSFTCSFCKILAKWSVLNSKGVKKIAHHFQSFEFWKNIKKFFNSIFFHFFHFSLPGKTVISPFASVIVRFCFRINNRKVWILTQQKQCCNFSYLICGQSRASLSNTSM